MAEFFELSTFERLDALNAVANASALYHLPRWPSISTENGIEPQTPHQSDAAHSLRTRSKTLALEWSRLVYQPESRAK